MVGEEIVFCEKTGEVLLWTDRKFVFSGAGARIELRTSVDMVFQRPNPLPISVYENVVFGLRIHTPQRDLKKTLLDEAV